MPRIRDFRGMLRPATLWPPACYLYFWFSYRSAAYLAGGLLVLAAWYALYASWERARNLPLGPAVLALLALGLPAAGSWQALQLQDMGDLDHADYVCAFWNLMRGGTRYSIADLDIFGTHANYTCVLWLPIQLLGGPYALKLGKALCLLAAAGLLLKELKGDRRVTSWAAAALLLSPPIASQFFFGFHPEFLAAPLLVLAFMAYREERLGRFLLLTALLAYTKETFTLAVGGLLLVALLERRPWRWVLLPGLLCSVQMAVYWLVVRPHFSGDANHLIDSHLPTSAGQVLDGWFRIKTLQYAIHVTFPFLPLMLAMPKRYLLLPLPLMAFYAAFPSPLYMVQWPNYSFPLAFLCAAGLVLRKDLRVEGPPGSPSLDGRILAACAVLSLLSYPLWREILSFPTGNLERRRELMDLRERVPDSASVLLHGPIAVPFAGRKEVQMWGLRTRPIEAFDYVVLETALPYWLNRPDEMERDIRELSSSPRWTREYARDGLYAFRRVPAPADSGTAPAGTREPTPGPPPDD